MESLRKWWSDYNLRKKEVPFSELKIGRNYLIEQVEINIVAVVRTLDENTHIPKSVHRTRILNHPLDRTYWRTLSVSVGLNFNGFVENSSGSGKHRGYEHLYVEYDEESSKKLSIKYNPYHTNYSFLLFDDIKSIYNFNYPKTNFLDTVYYEIDEETEDIDVNELGDSIEPLPLSQAKRVGDMVPTKFWDLAPTAVGRPVVGHAAPGGPIGDPYQLAQEVPEAEESDVVLPGRPFGGKSRRRKKKIYKKTRRYK